MNHFNNPIEHQLHQMHMNHGFHHSVERISNPNEKRIMIGLYGGSQIGMAVGGPLGGLIGLAVGCVVGIAANKLMEE